VRSSTYLTLAAHSVWDSIPCRQQAPHCEGRQPQLKTSYIVSLAQVRAPPLAGRKSISRRSRRALRHGTKNRKLIGMTLGFQRRSRG